MKIRLIYPESVPAPREGRLRMGDACYGVNSRFFTRNGRPWLPVMTEMHYSRVDPDCWEEEICKLKACGADIVSCYMFWNHHEEQEGVFNFSGDRDLRRFVTLCGAHGLKVWIRPGPWCHGEARYGGFPDWLLAKCPVRCNDDTYLGYVRRLFAQYAQQLRGLLTCDGGPVIGMQIENELTNNADHLLRLKEIALECGLRVPYYSVTAWSGSGVGDFPALEVLPFFGSYPEAPWDGSVDPLEGSPCCLSVPGRSDGTIGSDQILTGIASKGEEVLTDYPYATCETGPGIQITHHRRPVIAPMDVYSMAMTQIGKGSALIGYYMFHGGRNPEGPTMLYQESRDTGYPNNVPVRSYDFQAPLSEYNTARPSYAYFRLLHHFLHSAEASLLAAEPVFADAHMTCRQDVRTPRAIFRAEPNGSGHLFVNTYQRLLSLAPLTDFQAALTAASGRETMLFPREPIDIPSGISAVFPIRQPLGSRMLEYATAQPIITLEVAGRRCAFFAALDGVRAEFAFADEDRELIRPLPSRKPAFVVGDTSVYLLSFADALRFQTFGDRVFLSENALYDDGSHIVERTSFAAPTLYLDADAGEFRPYAAEERGYTPAITLEELPIERFACPDSPFVRYLFSPIMDCRAYALHIPADLFEHCDDAMLRLSVQGDIGELFAGERMPLDFYVNGEEIVIGLRRLREFIEAGEPLHLLLSPMGDKRVYLERYVNRRAVEARLTGVDVYFTRVLA